MHHPRAPVSGTCLWCWSLGLATVHFTAAMTLTILFCFLFFCNIRNPRFPISMCS
jgi:hypothetical protein